MTDDVDDLCTAVRYLLGEVAVLSVRVRALEADKARSERIEETQRLMDGWVEN